MHHSVWVNPDQCHTLQARDRIHSQRQLCQEVVDPPSLAILRREGRPIVAEGLRVIHEDRGELGWDFSSSQILCHQLRWP